MDTNILKHLDINSVRFALKQYYDGTLDDVGLDNLKLDAAEYVALYPQVTASELAAWNDIDADLRVISMLFEAEMDAIPEVEIPENLASTLNNIQYDSSLTEKEERRIKTSSAFKRRNLISVAAAAVAAIVIIASVVIIDRVADPAINNVTAYSDAPDSSTYNTSTASMKTPMACDTAIYINQKMTASAASSVKATDKPGGSSSKISNVSRKHGVKPNEKAVDASTRRDAIKMLQDAGYEIKEYANNSFANSQYQLASRVAQAVAPGMRVINASFSNIEREQPDDDYISNENDIYHESPVIYY